MYGEMLSWAGYAVVTAADGEEALAYVSRLSFDAIVLDLHLPKVDGLTIIAQVRARGDTPIVTLSAGEEWIHDEARKRGADVTLSKPCLPHELLETIRSLLESRGDDQKAQ